MCSLVFVLIIIHIYCSAKPILIFFEISYKWKKIHPPLKAEFRKSTWRNPVVHPIIYLFILHRPIRNNKFCWIYKKNFLQCRFPCLPFKASPLKACFVLSKSSDSGFRECQWYSSSNSLPIGNTSSLVSSLKGENWTAFSEKIIFSRNSIKHAGYFELWMT